VRVVLLGPPGAGKGTQAQIIAERLGVPAISTGDIFRANVSGKTELGQKAKVFMDAGDLVPDEITVAMVKDRLTEPDAKGGFLLDGFPRTIGQAEMLEETLKGRGRKVTGVLLIEAPDDEVVRRLSGRRTCAKGNHVYHVEFDPPKNEGVCDQDGSRLIQRDDDRAETVRKRLSVYHDQTEPLIKWYEDRSVLHRFDGTRPPDEVHGRIRATLAAKRLEDEL
jgi:adenylate kinase